MTNEDVLGVLLLPCPCPAWSKDGSILRLKGVVATGAAGTALGEVDEPPSFNTTAALDGPSGDDNIVVESGASMQAEMSRSYGEVGDLNV